MSHEDRLIHNLDKKRESQRTQEASKLRPGLELPSSVKKAHERLKATIFSNPEYAVQAPEFSSLYGREGIMRDMQEVILLRKKFEQSETPETRRAKILSEVFEGLVLVNAKDHKWFGDGVFYKTSAYDDLKNKTDMYGEWISESGGSRVLALAVDLTFSSAGSEDKLSQIVREIDRGEMRQIRYFKDSLGDFKGTRYNVPRIVLGVGTKELAELSNLWINNKTDRLSNHHVKTILITEMYTQISALAAYAERKGKTEVERAYRQALSAIEPLYRDLQNVAELGEFEKDPVLTRIREKADSL